MRRILRARLLASVLAVGIVPMIAVAVPAQAQDQYDVSFDSFHDALAQYGDWVYSDRWGLVWQPADVPDDFRPYYSGGHWAYTDAYGWIWASDYEWGDIAFHYGRWVDDPYDGWMWIPGYSWSPGWVIWRSNQRSIGWMPMPPDDDFLAGRDEGFIGFSFGGVAVNWNDASSDYGYSRWYGRDYDQRRFAANWTFVDTGHMADRDYRHVAYAPDRVSISIRQTTNITNYTVVNNYVVNRSVDVHAVERASGHPVVAVTTAAVFKHPNSVMTVAAGQKIRAREFDRAPHGSGIANSAPPPPAAVIGKLSDHVAAHHAGAMPGKPAAGAGAPSHLFTKTTITAPAATTQFHGKPHAAPINPPPAGAPLPAPANIKTLPGTTTGPSGTPSASGEGKMHEQHKAAPTTMTAPAAAPVSGPPQPHTFEHKVSPPETAPVVTPAPVPVVKPREHKVLQPVTAPAAAPATEPVVKPQEHRVMHQETPPVTRPVAEPMAQPVEHREMHRETPPVVKPVAAPMVQPVEHKAVQPVPVVHNPPPVVESPKPPAKTEPKKDEHKGKPDPNAPN
ncbi:MAG: DUF6600 domain-containing protein [Rhizomicrobium sp.]